MGRPLLILLDTHVVLWLAQEYQRLSPKAQSAIGDARKKEAGLAISGITLVEVARLASRGRIKSVPDAGSFLSEVERRFTVIPITSNIAMQAFDLPAAYPKDPADRVIGATALIEDLPLVTADRDIRQSNIVPTIW
jgi:PIN domain nuclease of toxin-antitoxin system